MSDRITRSNRVGGISRRGLLQSATLGIAGLGLADVLKLQAMGAPGSTRPKSAIMIFLSGGPSHLDMYDMKPEAPLEYRGEPHQSGAQASHDGASPAAKNRAMISVVSSHSWVALASCFRPARVSV